MIPRIYWAESLRAGEEAALGPDMVHYLRNVLRRRAGDEVRLFNASDGEFAATLTALEKRAGRLHIDAKRRSAFTSPDLTLAIAVLKRGPLELVVEKATEMGVCAIQLVTTDYTNQQAVRQDRLEAIAREAAEQTERFDLPLIREPISLDLLLEQVSGTLVHADESLARPDVYPPEAEASDHAQPALNLPATVLIGPEGGFSPTERARLLAHPRGYRLSLGPRILRAETAAIAALTIVQSRCGDWGHGN